MITIAIALASLPVSRLLFFYLDLNVPDILVPKASSTSLLANLIRHVRLNDYSVKVEQKIQEDYDAFCLAYMFTYRDFEMGTLGLAWTGDLKNAGGVCEKNGILYNVGEIDIFN
uniref:Uncharacterized protein n=1 Tax=Glossina brevipalpis TaxID=37001 RepID=A0A1A9WTG3_9MUSC